ncbi:MAG TPA: hypothetical protein DDX98_10760 [Bacteroidales bacterium]|jgi:hypothetical protein|nr:hypothetical protein [Bacteroidales bacterium]
MKQIIIIGTEPPCPRCGLLTKVVCEKAEEQSKAVEVEHIAYTSERAKKIAKNLGLTIGTAKDVALKLGKQIDKFRLDSILDHGCPCSSPDYNKYTEFKWSPQLDDFLRPYEDKAKEVGILMTPVLIINNVLKHAGSVPKLEKIEKWIKE